MKKIYFVLSVLFLFGSISIAAEDGQGQSQVPANETSADENRVGGLNTEQLEQLALSKEVRSKELIWLEVNYPGQDEPVSVLALEQKSRMPQAQGAVLILHDKEQHADWPYMIRPLRMSLPDAGWYTLSVNLPYDDAKKLPERSLGPKLIDQVVLTSSVRLALQSGGRTMSSEALGENVVEGQATDEGVEVNETQGEAQLDPSLNNSESENVDIDLADRQKAKKSSLPYRERALLHIKAAMDFLSGKGYQNIIMLGYRSGADLALAHIQPNVSQIPDRGFALVMIDPLLQNSFQIDMAKFFGNEFSAPVLDIVNASSLDSRRLANERAVDARIANMLQYHQVSLNAVESGSFQQSLLRRVRFWLGKYAPGMAATKVSSRR